jgi:hypothetical protein
MTSSAQLRALSAAEDPATDGGPQVNLNELLGAPDGLDRLVAMLAGRLFGDPNTRRRFWQQTLGDQEMLLELAETVRKNPKLGLAMMALFGGGTLSNTLMWAAEDAHCWRLDPKPERKVCAPGQPGRYNHESVDVLLQPVIYFRPKGERINLWETSNVLERIRGWPQRTLSEDPDDPNNIILPGQSFVGTVGWLELPSDCICPLTASVDTRSTIARLAHLFLTPACPKIKNGHRGQIFVEPLNGSENEVGLRPYLPIGALSLEPMGGRAVPYSSQFHGQA